MQELWDCTYWYIALKWPRCNVMVERLIKTLKHGFTILSTNPEHTHDWDKHLPRILFGYRCGVQLNTKFSLYMLLTERIHHLKAYNSLSPLV